MVYFLVSWEKQMIRQTYFGYLSPLIKETITQKLSSVFPKHVFLLPSS